MNEDDATTDQDKVGALIDSLGVRAHIPEGALITDCIVIVKQVEADGTESVRCWENPGLGFVTQQGMIAVVGEVYRRNPAEERK